MKPISSFPDLDTASRRALPDDDDDTPLARPAAAVAASAPTAARFNRYEFTRIVAPLTAFLAANSNARMLDASPLWERADLYRDVNTLRLCYELDAQYFTGADTSLDEPLFALMRASRRGHPQPSHRIAITTELIHQTNEGLHSVWSVLVISVSRHADEEECLRQVNQMLLFVLRPGNIRPLDAWARRTLGRQIPAR